MLSAEAGDDIETKSSTDASSMTNVGKSFVSSPSNAVAA